MTGNVWTMLQKRMYEIHHYLWRAEPSPPVKELLGQVAKKPNEHSQAVAWWLGCLRLIKHSHCMEMSSHVWGVRNVGHTCIAMERTGVGNIYVTGWSLGRTLLRSNTAHLKIPIHALASCAWSQPLSHKLSSNEVLHCAWANGVSASIMKLLTSISM